MPRRLKWSPCRSSSGSPREGTGRPGQDPSWMIRATRNSPAGDSTSGSSAWPAYIRLVGSTEQVVERRAGRGPRQNCGCPCGAEGTASRALPPTPAVRLLLDTSPMTAVDYDSGAAAFAVEPGATARRRVPDPVAGWGVTIPAGGCPELGMGGHVGGGGFGPLCRRYRPGGRPPIRRRGGRGRRRPAPPAAWSPPASRSDPTTTCGGRTPAGAAATSAWSPGTG